MEKVIFITGATGNVGGKLVAEILQNVTDSRVILLVRGRSCDQAADRAWRTIMRLSPDFDANILEKRCRVVCGDITRDRLGLSKNEYNRLAEETTHIIHSAAATKFNMPEDQAITVNLEGTRHMAHFALHSKMQGGLTGFAYISTAFACGDRKGLIEEKNFDGHSGFSNNYEKSKWAAEQFLKTLAGDLPLTIFRPSIIVGDSQTGCINDFNVLYMPLRLILSGRLKVLPCRPGISLDVVPLDYVARVVSQIFFNERERKGRIYHVTAGHGNEIKVGATVTKTLDYVRKYHPEYQTGRVRYLPVATHFFALLKRLLPGNRIMSILEAYLPYFTRKRHFDNSNTIAALKNSPPLPSFETYFEPLMAYFLEAKMGKRLRAAA